jgi:hypothetical protein
MNPLPPVRNPPGRRFCFRPAAALPIAAAALLDHRHQIRFDNPLVGGQKPQAMDAGSGDNYSVRRISQRVAYGGHFEGHVSRERNDPKRGIGVQLMEQLMQSGSDPLQSRGQHRNFKQTDGTNAHTLSAPHGVFENPALLA